MQTNLFAKSLRHNMTDAERKIWRRIKSRQLFGLMFRRQVPMKNYILDFVCHEAWLVIEVDGGQHSDRQGYDDRRTAWLNSQGYRVLRFWNNEVLENIEGVLDVLRNELKDFNTAPPP